MPQVVTLAAAGFATLSLPGTCQFDGELAWTGIGQQADISLEGTALVQLSQQSTGRRIQLAWTDGLQWVRRSQLADLQAMASSVGPNGQGLPITLTLPGSRVYTVLFDQEQPIQAVPVQFTTVPADTDRYWVNLRFLTITP